MQTVKLEYVTSTITMVMFLLSNNNNSNVQMAINTKINTKVLLWMKLHVKYHWLSLTDCTTDGDNITSTAEVQVRSSQYNLPRILHGSHVPDIIKYTHIHTYTYTNSCSSTGLFAMSIPMQEFDNLLQLISYIQANTACRNKPCGF